jgi:hypothetical protein
MSDKKLSLGQAIDKIIEALEPLEETARQTAVNAACSHLRLTDVIKPSTNEPLSPNLDNRQPTQKQIDIRTFKEQKNPKSAIQMACVVAYYLQELAPATERKNTINTVDLSTYFKQANYKLPKVIAQLLPDSRVAGYFESASGKGEYSLNAVGYNLVAHNLPKTSAK